MIILQIKLGAYLNQVAGVSSQDQKSDFCDALSWQLGRRSKQNEATWKSQRCGKLHKTGHQEHLR